MLSRKEKRRFFTVSAFQVCFGLMDLLGVAIFGILGALALNTNASKKPGDRVESFLNFVHLQNVGVRNQFLILALFACGILVLKTLLSLIYTRKMIFYMSRRGVSISSGLINKLLASSLMTIQSRSRNELSFAITAGVEAITTGVLSSVLALISDFSLLLILGTGLFLVDTSLAVSSIFVFGGVAFLLYRQMHVRAQNLGLRQSQLGVKSSEKIFEVLTSYRESVVGNRRKYYSTEIARTRLELADTVSELAFLPNVSKYILEITAVVGSLGIAGLQFMLHDASHAFAVLAVFLAASTRIAPAVLRIQQGGIKLRGSFGAALPTLELIEELSNTMELEAGTDEVDFVHDGFNPDVIIRDVSFTYPGAVNPALDRINLDIPQGSVIAIVGPSGAGKTTLVDVLLGVIPPDSGYVEISGLTPLQAIERWPGGIAYVPQDVMISNGSIRDNVIRGYPTAVAPDEKIWEALVVASLDSLVDPKKGGLDAPVGDRGTKISGGQRQRLGIARALFTKPHLLVLDEATASLDGSTEASVSESIQAMKGKMTVVMIAHRLSTVKHADLLIYMDKGKVVCTGSFEEVRNQIPEFNNQAILMGL